MSDLAIEVNGLSKRYRIGTRESYRTLRDWITDGAVAQWRRAGTLLRRNQAAAPREEVMWALRDLSFTVGRGEVLGVIGRNGAGKSTLLKILSRITGPTAGAVDIHGRVRSLLEVGTGFHPELTGRENIYLNGAILGMKKADIAKHFDAIVAFAEVEKFIDTPVKRFSSGMYLRLAFAVAAHLTSEILLVDEVLAVGDAAFQKKCLGKMDEVAHEGRTVLFVSHNLAAVRALCHRGLLLEQGKLAHIGGVEKVLFEYTRSLVQSGENNVESYVTGVQVNQQNPGQITCGEPFEVSCIFRVRDAMSGFRLFCIVQDVDGDQAIAAPANHRTLLIGQDPGCYNITMKFPGLWLRPGVYSLYLKLIVDTTDSGSARFFSDTVMLDVTGTTDPELMLGYLTPAVTWHVSPQTVLAGR